MVDLGKLGESFMKFRGGVEDVLTTTPIKLRLKGGRLFETDPTTLPGSKAAEQERRKIEQEALKRALELRKLQKEVEGGEGGETEEERLKKMAEKAKKLAAQYGLIVTGIDLKTGLPRFGRPSERAKSKAEKEAERLRKENFSNTQIALKTDLNSLIQTASDREDTITKLREHIDAVNQAVEIYKLTAAEKAKLMDSVRKAQNQINTNLAKEGKPGIFGEAPETGGFFGFGAQRTGQQGF